jgi:hypothetical protein
MLFLEEELIVRAGNIFRFTHMSVFVTSIGVGVLGLSIAMGPAAYAQEFEDPPTVGVPDFDVPVADIPTADIPLDNIPTDPLPEIEVPEQEVPEQDPPVQESPEEDVPQEEAPEEEVPQEDVPAEETPQHEGDECVRSNCDPEEEAPEEQPQPEVDDCEVAMCGPEDEAPEQEEPAVEEPEREDPPTDARETAETDRDDPKANVFPPKKPKAIKSDRSNAGGQPSRRADPGIASSVSKTIGNAAVFCDQLIDERYQVDCVGERLLAAARQLPQTADYAEARAILTEAGQKIRALARANRAPNVPVGRARGKINNTEVRTRPLVPVKRESIKAVSRQAANILQEAETKLLRAAAASDRRLIAYAQIAKAVGSNKKLLRSA